MRGNFIYHLRTRILEIIGEEVQPLRLMVELNFRNNVLRQARSHCQIGRIVRFFCHKYPRAKFLEIGAGIGGCTQHILEALDKRGDGHDPLSLSYDFTCISRGFFGSARALSA